MISMNRGILKMTKPKPPVDDGTTEGPRRDVVSPAPSSAIGIAHMPDNSKRLIALADQVAHRLRKCRGELHNNDANVILFESCERELRQAAILLTTGPAVLPG